MTSWCDFEIFLKGHDIDLYKDILLPIVGIDKIIAFIAIIYAIKSFRTNNEIAKINLHFQLNSAHREIWSDVVKSDIARISDANANASQISVKEERAIIFLMLHIRSLFTAYERGFYDFDAPSRLDVGTFFNKPLPRKVWDDKKQFYSDKFQAFIEKTRLEASTPLPPQITFFQRLIIFCRLCIERIIRYKNFVLNRIQNSLRRFRFFRRRRNN